MNDLEDARNDLHETNCKDRSIIHELTFNNRQLQLIEASLRERVTAADDQLRQLPLSHHRHHRHHLVLLALLLLVYCSFFFSARISYQLRQLRDDLDSSIQRSTHLEADTSIQRSSHMEASLQRARDTERSLTERCGELDAELADWKCRMDDALQLVESKEAELRHATTEHLMEVDRWREKVEELIAANSSCEASQATTKRDLNDAQLRENLLRKNMEELNRQLSYQEMSATQTKDQMNNQLSTLQERLFQLENCVESKELERAELEKSYEAMKSVLRQVEEEKSQLLLTLTDVRKERNDTRDEVKSLNETMANLQDRLLSSSSKCSVLEDWLGEVNTKNEAADQVWKSRVDAVDAEKRELYSRIVELETDVSIVSLSVLTSHTLFKNSTMLVISRQPCG